MTESSITCPRCYGALLTDQDAEHPASAMRFDCGSVLAGGIFSQGSRCPVIPPSVGRIVHYQSFGTPRGEYESLARAAIVTQVNEDGTVGLFIVNPTGAFFLASARYAFPPMPGHWSWPPRA